MKSCQVKYLRRKLKYLCKLFEFSIIHKVGIEGLRGPDSDVSISDNVWLGAMLSSGVVWCPIVKGVSSDASKGRK